MLSLTREDDRAPRGLENYWQRWRFSVAALFLDRVARTTGPEDDLLLEAHGRVHSFVVRLWFEPREIPGAAPQLRGEVREVLGDGALGFQSFDEIEACIRALIESRNGGEGERPQAPG